MLPSSMYGMNVKNGHEVGAARAEGLHSGRTCVKHPVCTSLGCMPLPLLLSLSHPCMARPAQETDGAFHAIAATSLILAAISYPVRGAGRTTLAQ
jgi:hypothetical protein